MVAEFAAQPAPGNYTILPGPLAGSQTFSATGLPKGMVLNTKTGRITGRPTEASKLDKDGNNLLSFEEWAVATSNRFKSGDANGDGSLTRAEFATTRPKQSQRPGCRC